MGLVGLIVQVPVPVALTKSVLSFGVNVTTTV
jgi:hypothetical protein